ncbi:MAG: hypothetical protein JXA33_18010 [Anaerolineae bacterium]|nr:hypothetical protein [Anaerolineae bacterium]
MRRIILILAVVIVSVGLLFSLFWSISTSSGRQVLTWRVILEKYLTYKGVLPDYTEAVVAASQAKNPQVFTPNPNLVNYHDLGYYITYNKKYADDDFENLPPFPPEKVMCVLLEHPEPPTAKLVRRVVFVNYYRDLYTASWMVYESAPAPFPGWIDETLVELGCTLDLEAQYFFVIAADRV